ncbi:MAG: hypothetical protein OEU54_02900 [Gemmatimonadota bacterium]|nr:hypothetical protein [Gemmatimonadota bacterium]
MHWALAAAVLLLPAAASAQDQSRESAALDNTASQWSFQLAYQAMSSYRTDTIFTGDPRAAGNQRFFQYRMVAPIPIGGVTVLPRATVRFSQNADGEWGLSPTDIFALILPFDWGTGRAGLGPDLVIPGSSKVGSNEWSYGLAGAVIQRFFSDKLMVGLLVQQTWGRRDVVELGQPVADPLAEEETEFETGAHPMTLNPFAMLQLGKGWYLGTNDLVAQYSHEFGGWKIPIGARLGYVLVQPERSWNFYVEYASEFATVDWPGAVAKNKVRANISLSMPVGG